MAKIDDEGNVTKVGDTSDEAVQSIINNWKALKNRDAERSSEYNLRFHQLMTDGNETKSNTAAVYVPSTDIEANIRSLSGGFRDVNLYQPLKKSEAGQATILIQQLQNQLEETQYVEQDVLSGNVNNLRTYLKDGREVKNFVSQLTSREKSFTITASKYKSAINHVLETQSNALMNMQVTPENQDEFIRRLSTVDRMEQLGEKKSAFTNKYETVFAPGVSPTPMGRNELQQAIAFHRYKQRVNPAYQAEAGVVAQLEALYTKTIDGKPLDEKQIATQSESILTNNKNTNAAAVNSKEMVKIVDDKLQDLADGTGQWFTMFNATMASGTGNALKQYIISNGKNIVAEDFMNNLPTVDYGSFVPTIVGATPDQRIVVPVGIEKETFKKAIDATINGYNKKHNTNFGPSSYNDSVVFRTVYDKGMDNFITEIYNRDDVNERIGVLHINNIDVTATK